MVPSPDDVVPVDAFEFYLCARAGSAIVAANVAVRHTPRGWLIEAHRLDTGARVTFLATGNAPTLQWIAGELAANLN